MISVIAICATVIAATIHTSPMLLELPKCGENFHDGFLPNYVHIGTFIEIDSYFFLLLDKIKSHSSPIKHSHLIIIEPTRLHSDTGSACCMRHFNYRRLLTAVRLQR